MYRKLKSIVVVLKMTFNLSFKNAVTEFLQGDKILVQANLKVDTHEGLVPTSCRKDKSHRVNEPFLPQNPVTGTKIWSLRLVP